MPQCVTCNHHTLWYTIQSGTISISLITAQDTMSTVPCNTQCCLHVNVTSTTHATMNECLCCKLSALLWHTNCGVSYNAHTFTTHATESTRVECYTISSLLWSTPPHEECYTIFTLLWST
ncbi:hypothetical protein NP493_289g02039 [Ridgeia piscesae]|uniref:Uncharacterized protein n=1 Tax=Ridgeia piscesae TaxID=27915 RepID=A0AAD9NWK6_RIDPI|nr:hypothetical protein NP493_289g02039 [Ridgeia piscesae]